jgi:uncharacterized protein YkwD
MAAGTLILVGFCPPARLVVIKVMHVPRHSAPGPIGRRRLFRALAASLAVAAALIGVACVTGLLGSGQTRGAAGGRPTGSASTRVSGPATACPPGPSRTCATAARSSSHGAPSPFRLRHPAKPDPRARHAAPRPAQTPPAASAPAPAPSGTGSPTDSTAVAAVLALINQARAQAGHSPYIVSSGLQTSSGRHNQLMASGCGLSHQCPGEAALGSRETAAGVHWTAAGENIGDGGSAADTTAAITQMALTLTRDMLNEKPPGDGHRQNLLSPTFTHVGITIYRGSDGTVWMTQDFSN